MNSLRNPGGIAFLLCSIAGLAAPAGAQVATGGAPTREEINRAPVGADTRPPSRLTVEGGIERAPCPLDDPKFAGVTVTVSQVMFDNLKVVAPEILKSSYESYIGKTVSIATVCEIRDAAATILRRQGYLAAVQVPPQRIENGIIHFDVLMARIVQVQVRGDAGKSERLIAGYLDALKGDEVFNERLAERYLLLARDLPGYDVRLTLRPAGTAPGEVLAEVSVARTPIAIDANIQNYGSRDVGRFGGLLRGEAYDLLGFGDRLTLGFFSTADFKEQQVAQGGYDIRVGREGLTLGARFTYAWTNPSLRDTTGTAIDITSHTLVASLEGSYPFLRTQATNLRGAAGFDFINQDVRLPSNFHTRDRLRIFYSRIDVDAIDRASIGALAGYSAAEPRWRATGSLEVRQGIAGLGASDGCGLATPPCDRPPSRANGKPDAFEIRVNGQLEYRPLPKITFVLSPRAQYSTKPLFSYEQYSAGNYTVGRGYDPGSLIGDSGAGFQAEIRFGSLVPSTRSSIEFQPYAFYDRSWVWRKFDPTNPMDDRSQQLSSVGGGVRATFGDHARLDVAVAKPLDRVGAIDAVTGLARRGDTRVLVSLTTKLWPWLR